MNVPNWIQWLNRTFFILFSSPEQWDGEKKLQYELELLKKPWLEIFASFDIDTNKENIRKTPITAFMYARKYI